MHEAALAQAALPHPVYVLGLKMRPYSIGHELWLIRQGSPFVLGVAPLPKHVYEAALICSEDWVGCSRINEDPAISAKIFFWKWKTRKANIIVHAKAFEEYRLAGSQFFETDNSPTPGCDYGRQPGAPFLIRVASLLVSQYGKTLDNVWDTPLGLAQMLWQSHAESEGALKVWNKHDEDFRKYIDAEEAKEKEKLCRH